MQASAILLAEIYSIERPPWAADQAAVAERAAAIEVRDHSLRLILIIKHQHTLVIYVLLLPCHHCVAATALVVLQCRDLDFA